jgi:hypothetical protein
MDSSTCTRLVLFSQFRVVNITNHTYQSAWGVQLLERLKRWGHYGNGNSQSRSKRKLEGSEGISRPLALWDKVNMQPLPWSFGLGDQRVTWHFDRKMHDFGTSLRNAKGHLQDVAFFLHGRAFARGVQLLERLKRWVHYGHSQKSLKKATRRCWTLL